MASLEELQQRAAEMKAKKEALEALSAPSPNTPSPDREGLRVALQDALGDVVARTRSDTTPLFKNLKGQTRQDPIPLERTFVRGTTEEVIDMIGQIAQDPSIIGRANLEARQIIRDLGKGKKVDHLREVESVMQAAFEQFEAGESDDIRRIVEECISVLRDGNGLDSLPDNPLAVFFSSRNMLTEASLKADIVSEDDIKPSNQNTRARAALAALTFATAASTGLLEAGTVKTAVIQLVDIYSPAPVEALIAGIATGLEKVGYDAVAAHAAAKTGFAIAVGAVGISGTLFATKQLKDLGPTGKTLMYGSLGLSLSMGYLALQNFIRDNSAVAEMGKVISETYTPIAEQGLNATADREKVINESIALVQAALDKELKRPGATGYGHFAAGLDRGLTGNFDSAQFKTGAPNKHEAIQAAISRLRETTFGQGNEASGLIQLLEQMRTIDLKTAPKKAQLLAEIGEKASKTDLWAGLGKVLNPVGTVTTPRSMYNDAERVTKGFIEMTELDKKEMGRIAGSADAWLLGMIQAFKAQGAPEELVRSLTTLQQNLKQKLQPLSIKEDAISGAFKSIKQPNGTWIIIPGEEEWTQIQRTIDGTILNTALGMDVAKEGGSRALYRAGLVGILASFFLLINYGSKFASSKLNKFRRRDFDATFHGDEDEGEPGVLQELGDREAGLARGIGLFMQSANQRFVLNAGAPELALKIPADILELYVRSSLRNAFLKEEGAEGALSSNVSALGWFMHGLYFTKTPEDVKVFNRYNNWLEKKVKGLSGKKSDSELEDIFTKIFPAFNEVVVYDMSETAQMKPEQRSEHQRELRRKIRAERSLQLREIAQVVYDRLQILPESEEGGALASVRLDIDGTRVIIGEEVALKALAQSTVKDERAELSDTLEYLKGLGITPRKKQDASVDLTVGAFPVGPRHAVQDQLERMIARQTIKIPGDMATVSDFERLDAYMAEIAVALREARDVSLASEPLLAGYIPIFDWHESASGPFTIQISLYPDQDLMQTPVATLTYPGPIPDFSQPDPARASQQLKTWLKSGGDAVRALVAQERHSDLQKQLREVLADIRKSDNASVTLPLIINGKKESISDEKMELYEKALALSERIDEQGPSVARARYGKPLPEDKYQSFLKPEEYASDARSGVLLSPRINAILIREDYDSTIQISYNVTSNSFIISNVSPNRSGIGALLPNRSRGTELRVSIPVRKFTDESFNEALKKLSSEE